jgi:hypothetical protein
MKVIEVAGEAARNRWGEMVDTALVAERLLSIDTSALSRSW